MNWKSYPPCKEASAEHHEYPFRPFSAQNKPFSIYGVTLSSRLLLGTAQYPTLAILRQAIEQAKPGMITVSLRRNNAQYDGKTSNPFWTLIKSLNLPILPNTAGCHSVKRSGNRGTNEPGSVRHQPDQTGNNWR